MKNPKHDPDLLCNQIIASTRLELESSPRWQVLEKTLAEALEPIRDLKLISNSYYSESEISQLIANTRFQVLELLEQEYAESGRWLNLRSKILKYFGRNGLESILLSCYGGDNE